MSTEPKKPVEVVITEIRIPFSNMVNLVGMCAVAGIVALIAAAGVIGFTWGLMQKLFGH